MQESRFKKNVLTSVGDEYFRPLFKTKNEQISKQRKNRLVF
jgi:hypothetical protein